MCCLMMNGIDYIGENYCFIQDLYICIVYVSFDVLVVIQILMVGGLVDLVVGVKIFIGLLLLMLFGVLFFY